MKKIICFIIAFIITLSTLSALLIITLLADDTVFDGGNGTEEFPYFISTPAQLNEVRNYPDSYFIQTADIDMTGTYHMVIETLNGGYDGGGHYIKGLTNSLFGENNGYIRNLGLKESNVKDSGHSFTNGYKGLQGTAATLAIVNNGEINGCYSVDFTVNANVSYRYSTDIAVYAYSGGLVCENKSSGIIENCYSIGTTSSIASATTTGPINTHATARARSGGIAANNAGVISNCYSISEVSAGANKVSYTGSTEKYAGVLCAFNTNKIENCYYAKKYPSYSGVPFSSNDAETEAIEVTEDELKSYAMISKLNKNNFYTYQMDIYGANNNYPCLNTQESGTMGIVTSHKSGNYKGEFELNVKLEYPNGGTYNLYYAIIGKNDSFLPCSSPISITDKNTAIIVYVENAFNKKMRRMYKLDYRLADHPVSASYDTGKYSEPLSIILTNDEKGAEIYYTTDGSDPKNGTRYTGTIPIFKNTTILTIAKVNGEFGDIIEYEYKISPVITPSKPAGSYSSPFSLTLKSSLTPYEIYYTTNGLSDPTKDKDQAIKYTGAFEIFRSTNLKVAACFEGEWSDVYTFYYEFPQAEITASIEPGEYPDIQTVDFSCNLPYAELEIRNYNTQEYYSSSVEIYKTTTLNVTATYKGEYINSKNFEYILPQAEVTSNPPPGSYNNIIQTELSASVPSYKIYYTLDGSDPEINGIQYTTPIELDKTTTIKTVAKYKDITIKEQDLNYTLDLPYVNANFENGVYYEAIDVTLSSNNAFYDVYYTLDGSDPKTNGIKYTAPIKVSKYAIIRTVPAFNNIFGTSSTYKYLILSGELEKPYITANYENGTYHKTFEVTLSSSDPLYDIYYTIDGKDPLIYGIKYSSPIRIKTSCILKAVPAFGSEYGKPSSYEYRVLSGNSPDISADTIKLEKGERYLSIYLSAINKSPFTEPADIYVALYNKKGSLLNLEKVSYDIEPTSFITYLSCDLPPEIPEDGYFKIICWSKDTMHPLFDSQKIPVSEVSSQ